MSPRWAVTQPDRFADCAAGLSSVYLAPIMTMFLYAALGGAIGAAGRYGVNIMTPRLLGQDFPWGTLVVNITGSFIMGVLIAVMAERWSASQEMRVFLTTGILGGFTTFSAFSLDFATLYERKQHGLAFAYAGSSVAVSLLAIFAGLYLARTVLQ